MGNFEICPGWSETWKRKDTKQGTFNLLGRDMNLITMSYLNNQSQKFATSKPCVERLKRKYAKNHTSILKTVAYNQKIVWGGILPGVGKD